MPQQVILPEKSGTYKFILIQFHEQSYLRCSRIPVGYHRDILERFMHELEVSGISYQEDELKISGGWVKVDLESRTMNFYGESSVFGRFDEARLREAVRLSGIRLNIE